MTDRPKDPRWVKLDRKVLEDLELRPQDAVAVTGGGAEALIRVDENGQPFIALRPGGSHAEYQMFGGGGEPLPELKMRGG